MFVSAIKFKGKELATTEETGGRCQQRLIIISSMSTGATGALLYPRENASQNELKHDAKRSADRECRSDSTTRVHVNRGRLFSLLQDVEGACIAARRAL